MARKPPGGSASPSAPSEATRLSAGHRITSYDVARRAGVSQSAVSRCFTPGESVAPATRERITRVAAEMGFRPNALAQALISRRSNLVAVLISSLTVLYYPDVLAELTEGLLARDLRVLLFSLHAESDVDEVLDQVWRHSVDGVICAARLSDQQVQLFEDRRTPLVLYNRRSTMGAASVCCDSDAGERDLVDRLYAAGHRRFGIISGPEDSYVGEERAAAALARLAEHGVHDVALVRGDFSYESGADGLGRLMEQRDVYDAIICVSDLMAIGAIDRCREEFGLRVPTDISVVGFDGLGAATWASYRVTSVRQPVRRMTEAAVEMLAERIEDPELPAERRVFSGQFIVGKSARLS
jgi:DNA-binding LacI/PurR family transcriptional regulator